MLREPPRAAALKKLPKRRREYQHRPGKFTLTASFRDSAVDEATVAMVATLTQSYTQTTVARILGCGVSTVSKCVRITAARKGIT